MLIKRFPAGVYAANCYIIMDEATRECAVIDPGGDAEDIENILDDMNANVKCILLTHGHADHTGAVGYLSEKYNVKNHIHKQDGILIQENSFMFGPLIYKGKNVELTPDISENTAIELGNTKVQVIETPGHTPGGVCYQVEKNVFTGDTLFLRSIGRTDLTGGSFETLIKSIKDKLLVLADDTVVYPGHGPSTSIKFEREHNSFL